MMLGCGGVCYEYCESAETVRDGMKSPIPTYNPQATDNADIADGRVVPLSTTDCMDERPAPDADVDCTDLIAHIDGEVVKAIDTILADELSETSAPLNPTGGANTPRRRKDARST